MLKHLLLASALAAGGCYVEEPEYPIDTGASLAYVSPGVEVVTGFDYPVFFVNGLYWRWYGGYWYSSSYWDRGWVYAPSVPYTVRGIHRPWNYSHYRPGRGVYARPAPRPVVRDHRHRR